MSGLCSWLTPAPGRARGTYASLGEHWCESPARSLEVVQAQPTSLESGGGGQGQLSSWGSQAFLSQTGEPHSHVLLCFAGLHTMGISPSFGSAHAACITPGTSTHCFLQHGAALWLRAALLSMSHTT